MKLSTKNNNYLNIASINGCYFSVTLLFVKGYIVQRVDIYRILERHFDQ